MRDKTVSYYVISFLKNRIFSAPQANAYKHSFDYSVKKKRDVFLCLSISVVIHSLWFS